VTISCADVEKEQTLSKTAAELVIALVAAAVTVLFIAL